MKQSTGIIFCTLVLCVLFQQNVSAEGDTKKEIGAKLGAAMKKYSIEMFRSNMKSADEFYDFAMKDLKLSDESKTIVKTQKEKIAELRTKLNDESTTNLVQTMKIFAKEIMHEILALPATDFVTDKADVETLQMAVGDYAEDEGKFADILIEKLDTTINEILDTIPKEEMDKYAEYTQIKNDMEKLVKIDRKNMTKPQERNEAFRDLLKDIITFFEFTEWKKLLEKNN